MVMIMTKRSVLEKMFAANRLGHFKEILLIGLPISRSILSIFLHFIGSSKLSLQSDTEITLEKQAKNRSFQ